MLQILGANTLYKSREQTNTTTLGQQNSLGQSNTVAILYWGKTIRHGAK
jgi:hypothetical protein